MTVKLKDLVGKTALEYILTEDGSILRKATDILGHKVSTDEEMRVKLREYGSVLGYGFFKRILKKRDRKYHARLIREIREKKENAKVDIAYLEKIIPEMKAINVDFGLYNKEYTMADCYVGVFGVSIESERGISEMREGRLIIPYNLRMKKELNPSSVS